MQTHRAVDAGIGCWYRVTVTTLEIARPLRNTVEWDERLEPPCSLGTVELMVRSSPKKGSPARRLILHDVLHIPNAVCNGFCFGVYHFRFGGSTRFDGDGMQSFDAEGHPLWYGEKFHGLERLALDGNPQGETLLSDGPKFLSLYIDEGDLEEILS